MLAVYSIRFWILFVVTGFVLSCGETEPVYVPDSDHSGISQFSFLRKNNPGLTEELHLSFSDGRFTGRLPLQANIKTMVASFTCPEDCQVEVNGVPQESGVTVNDFTQPVLYQVTTPSDSVLEYVVDVLEFTGLPVISIDTDGKKPVTSKEDYIGATISVNGGRFFAGMNATSIEIRGRGNSTWYIHPKKPYQIKFEDKTAMLDMPSDKRWLLLAEYSDKTFLRNRIAFELGYLSELEWTPLSQYAELIFNGKHQGLYHITQKVEESKNRVNITDEGYLLEIDQLDRLDPGDVYFYSDHFLLNIKEPEIVKNSAEYTYIRDYMLDFEEALFGPNFKDPVNGYQKYIDMESVVDWFLINEIAKNVDAKSFASIFMYKAPGEKLYMGPIWDFDLGFGNVNYADPEFPTGFWVRHNPWISRMLQDPTFVLKVKQRFSYFLNREQQIYDLIDEYYAYLYVSQWENDHIWNTLGVWVWPNSQVFNTYEEEIAYLKYWIETRLNWMEGAIYNL